MEKYVRLIFPYRSSKKTLLASSIFVNFLHMKSLAIDLRIRGGVAPS